MVSKVWKNGAEWASVPQRFEAGTANVADAVGFMESLKFLEKISWEKRREHEERLTSLAIAGLLTICDIEFLGPKTLKDRIGVVSFGLKDIHPHDLASLLDERGIAIRAGYHCAEPLHTKFNFGPSARISFGIYNTQDEVREFVSAIKSISNNFR